MPRNNITTQLTALESEINRLKAGFASKAGDIALRFIDGNFKAQGYQGTTFIRWAVRKSADKKRKGRAILVDRGRLRRGFRKIRLGVGAVQIVNDVPYAQIHNEGGTINMPARQSVVHFKIKGGRYKFSSTKKANAAQKVSKSAHNINMPKRQMAPIDANDSPVLSNAIKNYIIKELINIRK
jgi:phage gpG-like protein